jgi:hypothetical protein
VDPTIEVGETVQLTIGTDATWTTSDAEVATVDNTGLVTGISEGSATITATVAGVPYTILITVQPAVGGALPLTCAAEPAGGDRYYRGFYVPSYPGSSLAEVELQFSADITGSYTMRLTAFADVYDGVELGTAVASQDLNGRSNYVATAFDFGDPIPISLGSTVAFRIEYVSGPGTVDPNNILLFYRVPSNGDPTCPIAETNGTSPPLDTWRRDGIWVTISG